jgi:hypothetical protein
MAPQPARWALGAVIPVRHVRDGRVWHAHPAIVVEDAADRLVLFEPAGSLRQSSNIDFETGRVTPPREMARHTTDALILMPVGSAHAVSLFWAAGGGPFLCWYVDLQEPFRRSGGGVVTWDQSLDIVVRPNLQWSWKDEDQLARLPALGLATEQETTAIREEGERVVELIESRSRPFNEDWPQWRPDAEWPIPTLPDDWATPG